VALRRVFVGLSTYFHGNERQVTAGSGQNAGYVEFGDGFFRHQVEEQDARGSVCKRVGRMSVADGDIVTFRGKNIGCRKAFRKIKHADVSARKINV
jgi:hypothetical protein